MESTTTRGKTGCRLSIVASLALLLGGIGLGFYFLDLLSMQWGVEIWKFLLYEVAALLPIIAGGAWLTRLYRRGRNRERRSGMWGAVVFGVILVVAGVLLFIFSSGIVMPDWKRALLSWQMLLAVIGIIQLCKADAASGITFLAVGTFFLIPRIDSVLPGVIAVGPDFVSSYWPILIIIFGAALILGMAVKRSAYNNGRQVCSCDRHRHGGLDEAETVNGEAADSDGTISYDYVFSGSEQVFLEPVFRGGSIRAVFGGMELDLRHTSLPEGTTVLRVDAVFGGVGIKAPQDWNIVIESHSILGGVQDERRAYKSPEQDGRKLVIAANCAFGGCSIE